MRTKAETYLIRNDRVLAKAIKRISLPKRASHRDYFYALARAIMRQQLSGAAADSIERKFIALFSGENFPAPRRVLAMPVRRMRRAGLSAPKASYIKNLARAVLAKKPDLRHIKKLTDEEIIASLIKIKGIGQWTAEMFLMFALNRPDVFSYGDLGLRNAMRKLYKLKHHPTKKTAERISSQWRPHRTTASRYLWASLTLEQKEKV